MLPPFGRSYSSWTAGLQARSCFMMRAWRPAVRKTLTQRGRYVAAVHGDDRARGLGCLGQRHEGLGDVIGGYFQAQKAAAPIVRFAPAAPMWTLAAHVHVQPTPS